MTQKKIIASMLSEHYQEPVYCLEDSADFLGLSKRTIATHRRAGKLKGVLFRKGRYFLESELKAYLEQEFKNID
jgi:predicted site-specific integrase-resolvase